MWLTAILMALIGIAVMGYLLYRQERQYRREQAERETEIRQRASRPPSPVFFASAKPKKSSTTRAH